MDSPPLSENRLYTGAKWYASQGWHIIACHGLTDAGKCTCGKVHTEPKDIAKHPAISDWSNPAVTNPATSPIDSWWSNEPRYNVAVMCRSSGFFVIDIDPRSGGDDSFDKFEELVNGALPPTVEAITGEYNVRGRATRGRHLFYKVNGNEQLVGKLETLSKDLKGVDIKHTGYVLLNPSKHLSGVTYDWKPGHEPWAIQMAEAPEELLAALRKSGANSSYSRGGSGKSASDPDAFGGWGWINDLEFNGKPLDINRFLDDGIEEGSRAVDVYALACALANKYGTTDMDRQYIDTMMQRFNHEKIRPPMELEGPNSLKMHVHRAIDFVASRPKIEVQGGGVGKRASEWAQARQQEVVKPKMMPGHRSEVAINTSDPDDVYASTSLEGTLGGTVSEAANNGWGASESDLDVPKDVDALTEEAGGDPNRRSLTDTGNGRRLIDVFGSVIRYSPGLGFFHWDGGYWKPDTENLDTRELAKRLSPIIASEVVHYEDPTEQGNVVKWASQAKANSRLNNAIESATSDPRIIVDVEKWDSNPEHFGVLNGVIDLRTGDLLRGRPDLHITRRAPVSYTPGITNKRFQDFLDFGTGGDKEYQEWLQKAFGYTLTGLRDHDVMFMVYGPGGSGKNVLVESLVKAMGTKEYAWPMDSQILAEGNGHASSTDLYHWAELRGRRMIWVDELPESERLKENSVKKLTGSSEISARSPGEKPFTFNSRGKLWVTTNHRPIITDDAMWRRIRPIPWMNVPEDPDPGLKKYLFDPEGGLPAVLAWAVEGAIKILNSTDRDSLGWCKAVSEAAEVYRKNEDRIGMFLDEETIETPGASVPVKALFAIYRMWSEDRTEKPMSQIAFQRKLTDRGLDIKGQGARAEIGGRSMVPHTASSEIDWSAISRF